MRAVPKRSSCRALPSSCTTCARLPPAVQWRTVTPPLTPGRLLAPCTRSARRARSFTLRARPLLPPWSSCTPRLVGHVLRPSAPRICSLPSGGRSARRSRCVHRRRPAMSARQAAGPTRLQGCPRTCTPPSLSSSARSRSTAGACTCMSSRAHGLVWMLPARSLRLAGACSSSILALGYRAQAMEPTMRPSPIRSPPLSLASRLASTDY
mmetsp:Transcript_11276/g.29357  ORF Transcript_11276/g.29357 Transcript_11276/m.29357 type:complete len:209 (+) Transcript_11276:387-1013(+)